MLEMMWDDVCTIHVCMWESIHAYKHDSILIVISKTTSQTGK